MLPDQPTRVIELGPFACAALLPGLVAVVVWLAQWLPIGPVPEQRLVTTMWLDVINHAGCDGSALSTAHHAQWVGHQESLSRTLPGGGVPTRVAAAFVFAPACVHGQQTNTPHRWPKEARRWCGGVAGGCVLPNAAPACLASPHRPSVQRISGVQDLGNKKARRHRCRGLGFAVMRWPAIRHATSLKLHQVARSCQII